MITIYTDGACSGNPGIGGWGVVILKNNKDHVKLYLTNFDLFCRNKITKKNYDFLKIIGDNFDPLLVMEYLPGEEVSIDVFRDSENFISIPRVRDEIRSGISFKNSAVKRSDLIGYSKNSPYEKPLNPDLIIDTNKQGLLANNIKILYKYDFKK